MNKYSKIGIVVLIALGVTVPVICLFIAPTTGPAELEYFNLGAGSSLYYNSTDDENTWLTRRYIEAPNDFIPNFFGTYTVLWCEAHQYPGEESYTWVNQMWLGKSGNSLTWWGFEDNNAKVIASQGLIYVTEPVIVGQSKYGVTPAQLTIKGDPPTHMSVDFMGNYTIDAIESVTVPGGTFTDCIKVHEQEITPDGNISFYVWYAPNIGAVKYWYHQQNRTDVLTSYDLTPNNDPWNNWIIPYVPTMLMWSIPVMVSVIVGIIVVVIVDKKRLSKD